MVEMTRGKKAAIVGFCIFLGFMAVCTIIAKGIYASGLPRISTQSPHSGSITHTIEANGTVKQGQEYGVYVENGLRIATVCVRNGDCFETGDPLFQIETGDLQDMIDEKQLELDKLKDQQSKMKSENTFKKQEKETNLLRAAEDYARAEAAADANIRKYRQDYEQAKDALALYDQYLYSSAGTVSGNDYLTQYTRKEERNRLFQAMMDCAEMLEEAEHQKETQLLEARRKLEDAESEVQKINASTDGSAEKLDIKYQEKKLERYKELLEAGGWVYAETSGRVTDCRIRVGERVQDGASILYALDDGARIAEVVFTEQQTKYLSVGTFFDMVVQTSNGSKIRDVAVLDYLELTEGGEAQGKLSFESTEVMIGQTAQLSYKMQTETYLTCIEWNCIYQESESDSYVYVAEEREGILGTEWKVRKVRVTILDQNDTVAAIQSAEISKDSRIVSYTTKKLSDGDTVRLIQ